MKRTLLATCAMLLTAAAPALAQNPCTTPPTTAIIGATNNFWAELPDHTVVEPDGTPRVVAYQFAAWAPSAFVGGSQPVGAPSQGPTTIPKTAFVAVAGFANCYRLTGGLPGLIPQQTPLVTGLRAQAQTGAPEPFSLWGGPSNSFLAASVRVTPAAPGQTRVAP